MLKQVGIQLDGGYANIGYAILGVVLVLFRAFACQTKAGGPDGSGPPFTRVLPHAKKSGAILTVGSNYPVRDESRNPQVLTSLYQS